jgi:hypothetical protein
MLSIHSRDDPIVPPSACRITSGDNVEIGGSHGGLAHNRAAYVVLAPVPRRDVSRPVRPERPDRAGSVGQDRSPSRRRHVGDWSPAGSG